MCGCICQYVSVCVCACVRACVCECVLGEVGCVVVAGLFVPLTIYGFNMRLSRTRNDNY